MDDIKRYNLDDSQTKLLFDSAGTGESYYSSQLADENRKAGQRMDAIASVINDLDPSKKSESLGIWSQLRGGSEYNIYGQRALEAISSLRPNEDVIAYDIEALGTPTHLRKEGSAGFFAPTEIAMQKGKFMNGKLQLGTQNHQALSILLKPDGATEKALGSAIKQLKSIGWRGLSADMQRSLVDLSAYAGDPKRIFEKRTIGGQAYTHVLSHAPKVSGNASLAMPEVIQKIEQGFKNLTSQGTLMDDAISIANRFVPNKRGKQDPVRFVGYNTYNYDELALDEVFKGNVAKHDPGSKLHRAYSRLQTGIMNTKNIDLFHALKTVTDDPFSRFGSNMTLDNVHSVFGFRKSGTAHHALFDINMTAQITGKVYDAVQDSMKAMNPRNKAIARSSSNKAITDAVFFDKKPMKAGQEIYAFSGLPSYQAGEYDGVFKNEGGKLSKQYDLKQNPVYARTVYKVDNFFDKVNVNNQTLYGVQLSTDQGQVHTLFRQSKEELARVMHTHFMPVGKNGIDRTAALALQNEDRAVRRYNKMFEIGTGVSAESKTGFNLMQQMYQNLDEIKGMSWEDGVAKLKANYGDANWFTDSYVRDLENVKPRLEAEEKLWKPFMGQADGLSTNKERTVALRHFRDQVQEEIGTNKLFMNSGGEPYLPISVGGKESQLRGLDRSSMVRSMRSAVEGRGANVGRVNPSTMTRNFNELIENNLLPMMSGKKMTNKMREIQQAFHQQVMSNNSVSTIYEEVATMVGKVMNMNHNSMDGYERERVSAVSAQYAANIQNYSSTPERVKNSIQRSLSHASHHGQTFDNLSAGVLKDFFGTQKESIKGLINKAGIDPAGLFMGDMRSTEKMTNIESKVKRLVEAYEQQGFRVQMFHDKAKGLSLGIMDANAPESLARKGYAGLRMDNNAAVIHLPSYADGGKIRWRNQEHLNRFVANIHDNGKLGISTVFDEAINGLIGGASRFKQEFEEKKALGERDFFIRMQSRAEKKVQKVLERSPMDYNLGYTTKDDMFEVRSNRANFNRSMVLDTHKMAEAWYDEKFKSLSPDDRKKFGFRPIDEVRAGAKKTGNSFFENMHFNARALFNTQVDQWARNKYNLDITAHGVNDRHMAKGYRSLTGGDPRMQSAFGAFDPTSGENRLKSLNYYGLDKDNVAKALGKDKDDAMVRRRTNYGTVTRLGEEVKGTEVDGISMRAAYMSDEQIAQSLANNKDALMKSVDGMQAKGEISAADANKYKDMIKKGQLSTYEGMSLLSKEFQDAFTVTRNVRERLRDGYEIDGNLHKALADHAEKLGIEGFDMNKSVNFDDMGHAMSVDQTRKLMDKDGKLTVGRMTSGDIERTSGYTGSNKNVFIKGWDAENKMLLLGQIQHGDDAMKTVTTTGRRHTETFIPQKLLGIIAGNEDVEAIIPEFSKSKRMGGAYLEEKVRSYEDELVRQLHGESKQSPAVEGFLKKHGITMGSLSKEGQIDVESRALNEMLVPKLRDNLGLTKSDIWAENGKIFVNEQVGFTEETKAGISPSGVRKLDEELGRDLGYRFRGDGVDIAQVIKQRHDVWADQFAVGKDAPEGRVRLGLKEIDAIRQHVGEVDDQGGRYVDFLKKQVRQRATGGQATREAGQYILNALAQDGPRAGDVVFDMTALRPSIESVEGKELNARMGANGALYVNPDSVRSLSDIQITAKDTKIYADEYAQTLLDSGRLKVTYDENGNVRQSTVKEHLSPKGEYKGTAYLRLPDNSFGQQYMPLVDFQNIGNGNEDGYLNELQKVQRNIIEDSDRYNKLGRTGTLSEDRLAELKTEIQGRINKNLTTYKSQMEQYLTSGSESGFMNKTANARMDMSGHFRAQGANPFASYSKVNGQWENTGHIKENVAYINANDMKTMIAGAEDNILDVWSKTGKDKLPTFDSLEAKQDFILKNVNQKGLYGTTIRYPIIDASTAQTMKYEVGNWVGEKSMFVGVGATSRIAGDYDGDVFAGLLTGYKSKTAPLHHQSLERVFQREQAASIEEGRSVMEDLAGDVRKNLMASGRTEEQAEAVMSKLGQSKALTMQDLTRAGFDEKTSEQVMRAKTTIFDNIESVIARTGKEYIGHIDNARQRISTMHGITQNVMANAGEITMDQAQESKSLVNEVTRRLSQDSISSKKFTVGTLMKDGVDANMTQDEMRKYSMNLASMRNEKLASLREQLYNPRMDVETTIQNLKDIGVIKPSEKGAAPVEVPIGLSGKRNLQFVDDEAMFRQGLESIKQTNQINQHVDGYKAAALKIGGSKGTALENLLKTGEGFVPTDAVKELYRASNEEGQARFSRYQESYQEGVLRLHKQNQQAEEVIADARASARATGSAAKEATEVLAGDFVENRASARFKDVASKMMPDVMKSKAGLMTGAVAGAMTFGAMWATSAAMRNGPTPEGMREQQAAPGVSADRLLTSPTARVTENNGEYINLKINAKSAQGMSHADVSNIVNRELQSMSNVQHDMNLNVQDNSQSIDQKWLQDIVANAMNKGYAF